MILTFTANPAIDRTIVVDTLELDRPLRPTRQLELPGGKGINVVRAAGHLADTPARCHGPLGGDTGRWVASRLTAEGIDHALVLDVDGDWATRATTVVADATQAVLVYDRGDVMPSAVLDQSVARCLDDLAPGTTLVASGSLPSGDHLAAWRRLLTGADERGATVVVDSSGDGLRVALEVGVDVVKVDRAEAAELTGTDVTAASARALLDGCERAIVTAAAEGASAASRDGTVLEVPAVAVEALHPAGSGDAFAAGLVVAQTAGATWPDALRSAAAAGAANTRCLGAGILDRETHRRLLADTPAPAAAGA